MVFCDLVTGLRQKQNYNTVKQNKKINGPVTDTLLDSGRDLGMKGYRNQNCFP